MGLGTLGAEIVADFFKHDETLKKVWLDGCSIGPRGTKAIAKSLKHNRTVGNLIFTFNPIMNEGAEALIDALGYNVSIGEIALYGTDVASELAANIEYLSITRNGILIPVAVRRASLCLIAARRNITDAGVLSIFPKEIIKMIALEVWATRKDPKWLDALSKSERTGISGDEQILWNSNC